MKSRIFAGLACLLLLGSCVSPMVIEKQVPIPATPAQVVIVPQAQPIIIRDSAVEKTIDSSIEDRIRALEQAKSPVKTEQVKPEVKYIGCKQEYVPPVFDPVPVLASETFARIPKDKHADIQGALLGQVERLDQYIKDMKAKHAQAYEAYKKSCKK